MKRKKIQVICPGYALLISLILLIISTGVVISEFQYQKQQSEVNREIMQKLQSQIKQNLNNSNNDPKENIHKFRNK